MLGKSCSFGLLYMSFVNVYQFVCVCVCVCFPFGFEGGILDLIVVKQNQGRTSSRPPVFLLLVVPRRLFCFGSLVFFPICP